MSSYWWAAIGGGLGALTRFHLTLRFPSGEGWPITTWLINLGGSTAIGLLFVIAERGWISSDQRALLMVGLLGGFTTFSTFSLELLQQVARGAWGMASAYAVGSVISCLLGAGFGVWLMRQWV